MYRKKATWSSPVQNPKLQELDELASCVYTLLVPSFEELHRRFDGRRLPVKPAEIVAAVLPFVFDGSVPLHRVLGSHEAVKAGLLRLVADASGGRPTLMFDVFRAALMEGHTRHFERCSQRPVTKWRRSAATVPLPDIEQAVPLASGMLCLCDSDSEHERFRILRSPANGGNWTVDGDAAAVLTAKLEGYTSACAVTEANGFPVFSQVDNLGASLVFVDPAGKVLHHGALASHATVLRWIPQMQRLAVGSALGDLSLWTCNGRQDPDTYIGHNGPVVNVGHLDLSGLLGTVGADGKAALVDPLSMTEVRSTTADEAFRCGAFSAAFNLVAAGGSSSNPLLVNASLPLRAKFEPLEDDVAPHEYVVVDVLFHRDQLASLDARGIVKLWDLRMFRCVETLSTATQRDTVMERLHQLGPDLLAVSGSATVVLEVDGERQQSASARADAMPLVSLGVLGASHLVTASSTGVKLWSTKTGENTGRFSGFSASPITCAAPCGASTVFVGHEDGTVSCLKTATEAAECCKRHSSAVIEIVADKDVLISFDVSGTAIASVTSKLGDFLEVPGTPASCIVRTCIPSFTPLCFTGMTSRSELVIFDLSDESPGQVTIDDVREYDVGAVLCNGRPKHVAFSLLQSLAVVCVADGCCMAIVGTHSGRSKRLLSWSSHGGEVVDLAYLHHTERPAVAAVESQGSVVMYNVAQAMNQLRFKPDGFLDVAVYAPITMCVFPAMKPHLSMSCARLILSIGCVMVATVELSCAVYRLDAVRVGDLDMFRVSASTWFPIGGNRGGASAYTLTTERAQREGGRLACKHSLALAADHPVVGSPPVLPRVGSPERASSPPGDQQDLRRIQLNALARFGTTPPPTTVMVPLETSARTLEPVDPKGTKWAIDDVPVKQRDAAKTLVHMRLLTQEMNPSRKLLTAANVRNAQPARAPRLAVPQVKKPHRLLPLHLSPQSELHPPSSSPDLL